MANPYALFKTDEKAEKEVGVILDYGDFGYRIARAGGSNKKFGKLLDKRLEPFRRQMLTNTMDEGVATKIMIETYVDAIILEPLVKGDDGVLSKKGLLDKDGNVLDGTKEEMIAQFTELPELFRDIQTQANQVALFRAAELDADIKNS